MALLGLLARFTGPCRQGGSRRPHGGDPRKCLLSDVNDLSTPLVDKPMDKLRVIPESSV